jgi:hypothetical protein
MWSPTTTVIRCCEPGLPVKRALIVVVKHRPWLEIAEFYRSLTDKHPAFCPMQKLVEEIASSKYASSLYASTPMPLC